MLTQVHTHFRTEVESLQEFARACGIDLLEPLEDTSTYRVCGGLGTLGPVRRRNGFVLRGLFGASDQSAAAKFLKYSFGALKACTKVTDSALTTRKRGGATMPELPVCGMATHAVLTSAEAIQTSFLEDAVFYDGWQEITEVDGTILCLRACSAISSGDFLDAVQDSHWAMARAVKPGLTKYYGAQWEEDEKPLLFGGPDTLKPVGTEKKNGVRTFEFTCYLEEGQHIRPMEIHAVRNAARKGEFHDHEFDEVRVVFNDQKTALQEAVPLLDVGSKVYFIGEDTELVELTADDVIRLRGG